MDEILHTLKDSVILVDRAGVVRFANRAAHEACGLGESGLPGKKCKGLRGLCPLPADGRACPLGEVIRKGKAVTRRYERTGPRGRKKVLEVEALPVPDPDGGDSLMVEIVRDVTERARIEELLERSAEGMTVLYEISSAFLSSRDFSRALEDALSNIGEYYGADFAQVAVPDEEGKAFELVAGVGWENKNPRETDCEISRNNMPGYSVLERRPAMVTDYGKETRFERPLIYEEHGVMSGVSVPIVSGDRAVGVLCLLYKKPMGLDTAELWYLNVAANSLAVFIQKERSLERAEESEAFLASVLESIGEGLVVVERDMRIISANKAYLEMAKAPLEEVLGRHCYEVSHERDVPCYEDGEVCTVKRVFETGKRHSALHTHYASDGSPVFVQTHAYPIRDAFGELVAAVETVSDVTEKFKLEKDLEKRVRELEEFYDMAVGRELRMVELKDEIARLREEQARYRPQ
jgi:PAS domain S-box-containing protein